MPNGWTVIYSTLNNYEAKLTQGVLESEGINCLVFNQKDSMYVQFQNVEISLMVQTENVLRAKHLIEKLNGQ